jgi:hypothetical protein
VPAIRAGAWTLTVEVVGMENSRPAVPLGQRPWEQTLEACEDGKVLVDLDQAMTTAVAALRESFSTVGGKPRAGITLKVALKMEKGLVFVDCDVTTKLPKRERAMTLLYPTKDNTLARNDPKQGTLSLGEVPRSAPALTVLPAYAEGAQ